LLINTHFEDALLELENLVLRGKRPTSADNFDVKGLV
jgi:hypothetical protein